MKLFRSLLVAAGALLMATTLFAEEPLYSIPLKNIDGKDTSLKAYSGKALLIVNVASQCGFTPQYEGLEALYRKYKDKGLIVQRLRRTGAGDEWRDQAVLLLEV